MRIRFGNGQEREGKLGLWSFQWFGSARIVRDGIFSRARRGVVGGVLLVSRGTRGTMGDGDHGTTLA